MGAEKLAQAKEKQHGKVDMHKAARSTVAENVATLPTSLRNASQRQLFNINKTLQR